MSSLIALRLLIRNEGTDSVAWGWKAEVTLPGAPAIKAQIVHLPKPLVIRDEGGNETTITPDSLMYNQTEKTPIVAGGVGRGYLCIKLQGVHRSQVGIGTKVVLRFMDVRKRSLSCEIVSVGMNKPGKVYRPW